MAKHAVHDGVLALMVMAHVAAGDLLADCKANPTNATCANSAAYYTDAMVADDVEKLCDAMPQMPSCVIRDFCNTGSIATSSGHCGDWNILAGVCSTQYGEMMQGMAGCATYKMICVANSVVDSCSDASKQGPVDLITTEESHDGALAQCQADNALMLEISPAYMGEDDHDGHDHGEDGDHDGHDHGEDGDHDGHDHGEESDHDGHDGEDHDDGEESGHEGHDHGEDGEDHDDGEEGDQTNRRAMTKVCDMCDETRCTVGLHILSAGCITDMANANCAVRAAPHSHVHWNLSLLTDLREEVQELKKMCDANMGLDALCVQSESKGAVLGASVLLAALGAVSVAATARNL